jgi:hypothetical protein
MGIYTVDKSAFIKGLLHPSQEDITKMIALAGNDRFTHTGFDEFGMPIIACENKPLDSQIHGVRWINKYLEV